MVQLASSRIWTRQPQRSVALARRYADAVAVATPWLGTNNIAAPGANWAATSFGTAPTTGSGRLGVAIDATANYGGRVITPVRNPGTVDQTHVLVVECTGVAGSYAGLFFVGNIGSSTNAFSMQRNATNTGWWLYKDNVTSTADISDLGQTFGPTVIVLARTYTTATVYINGKRALNQTDAGMLGVTGSSVMFFGSRDNNTTYATKGKVYAYAGFQRRMPDAELQSLSLNPWQLFAPQQQVTYFGTAYNVNISETSTGSDSVSNKVTWVASLSETVTISDSSAASAVFITAIAETVTVSGSSAASAVFPTAIAETVTVSDSPAVTVSLGVSLSETVVASDTTTFSLTLNPAVVETVTAYASASTGLVAAAAVTETTTAADTITTITTLNVGVLEAGTALDVAVTTLTMGAAVLETLATSEFTSTLVTQGVVILETATSSDSTIIRGVYQSSLSETVVAADAATSRFLWEPIDTAQTPGWSNISTTQNANWSSITTTQTANWQPVNTGS